MTTDTASVLPIDAALAARQLVIIPAFNEAAHIAACLHSLLKDAPVLSVAEVIVMDGGSNDETCAIVAALAAQYPNLRVENNPDKHQAAALNLGARLGAPSRDILIRCDAHALYPKGFLLGVARALIQTGTDSLVVPMDATADNDANAFGRANAWVVDTPFGSGGSAHRGGKKGHEQTGGLIDHGHHAGFWRQRFLDLGGYDSTMVPNEDAEYDTRLCAQGGKVWLEPSLRIQYFPRTDFTGLRRQYQRYGAARARHIFKHHKTPRIRQMIPVLHVLALATSLALAGITALSAVYPILYGVVLILATAVILFRTKNSASLWTPVILTTMHTAWGLGFIFQALRLRGKSV